MKRLVPLMRALVLFCLLVSLLTLSPVSPARATCSEPYTVTVTSSVDNSDVGSLRRAIADVCPGGTIYFAASLAGNTIRLGTQLGIAKNLTIDGSGLSPQIIISGDSDNNGNGDVQVFNVSSGTFNLSNVTVSKGYAVNGGGIYNGGSSLTIINSTFSGNSATTSGGGVFSYSALTITNSTFSGNSASNTGGGIHNGGSLTITNSTFSGNSAPAGGGGIYNSGGPVNITNSTFSANSASGAFGGGIYNSGSTTLRNTIIANSTSGGNCGGGSTITNGGGNLIWGDTTCPGTNADPKLSALGNYGGPTRTFSLQSGSAAIDTGNATICAAAVGAPNYGAGGKDQRGVTRPQPAGGKCDIGAYELISPDFNSSFNGSTSGWSAVKGAWSLYNNIIYRGTGLASSNASAKHTGTYDNLTYEVRMKRTGTCTTCPNRIIIRGNPASLNSANWWKPSYLFQYANDGRFSVWKMTSAGSSGTLKSWTNSTAIVRNGWNILKVIAVGPSLKFYINGTLVWTGSDTSSTTGQVGFGFYRDAAAGTLYVDWAKLSNTPIPDLNEIVALGDEIPGGNENQSP